MITLWLSRHLGLELWIAFSEKDEYDTYFEPGVIVLWGVEW